MSKFYLLGLTAALACVFAFTASAIEIPKAAGKALGVTKGKPFSKGLVFVNGKYVEPPYVVSRWGNGIRINDTPVIAQVVDWSEFLKTQSGVTVTKTENAAPVAEPDPVEEEEEALDDLDDDSECSLDDLFDDDPKPKKTVKKAPKKKAKKRVAKPVRPTTTVSYALEGDFVPNDASKALVSRINKLRTDINANLLQGGILIFGDSYARVSGDAVSAEQMLKVLPGQQKNASSAAELHAALRAAGIFYITPPISADLYANRVDYLKLQKRRAKMEEDRALRQKLDASGVSKPF